MIVVFVKIEDNQNITYISHASEGKFMLFIEVKLMIKIKSSTHHCDSI